MLQTVKCRMIAPSVFATLRNSRIPLRWQVTVNQHVKPWNWKALYLLIPQSVCVCVCDRHAFMFASLSVWVCTCVHGCLCIYVCIDVCKVPYVGGCEWCVHHCETYLGQNLLEVVMVHQIRKQNNKNQVDFMGYWLLFLWWRWSLWLDDQLWNS